MNFCRATASGRPAPLLSRLMLAGGLALVLAAPSAQAGLFDDEEARKAILELRSRVQAIEDSARQNQGTLQTGQSQLLEQLQALRRSLVDMTGQLEAQRSEIARLRGEQERLARELAETQQAIKEQQSVLDARLKALEPQRITVDGQTFAVTPDERKAYDAAMGLLRNADFKGAAEALEALLGRYPQSGYTDSARFWLGNAEYGQKKYKEAVASFQALLAASPKHLRAPEAMLALANSQAEARDVKAARKTLEELQKTYPDTDAAKAGRDRLAALKG